MCELRRCQQCAGGEEYAREEELQRQASVPGSRPSLGPLPPASPMALTDKHCTQVLAAGSLDDLRNPGGMSAAFAPGLWTQWARGQAGAITGALPLPHHLLAICPRKPSFPPCHCCRACSERHWTPGWTLLCSAFSHRLSAAAAGPTSSSRKAGLHLSAACRAWHIKGPVRGFSEGRRSGVGSGLILNQSNMRSLLTSCVSMETAVLILTPIFGVWFLFQDPY